MLYLHNLFTSFANVNSELKRMGIKMKTKEQSIIQLDFSEEMRNSYRDYAMSVIIARALPDVRD